MNEQDLKTVLNFILEYGKTGDLPIMDEGGAGDVAYEAAVRLWLVQENYTSVKYRKHTENTHE